MSTKDFNISRDEFRNITRCLDNQEFRNLFMEYCNELRDNRKEYEDELSMLEAQRGYDVKFLKPTPGYVIKTIVNGKCKGFINVCQSELVAKPTSTSGVNEDGTKGLKWSIPYAQTHPRKDYDNKRVECTVYDVIFHPDALHLASKNEGFRKLLNDTSLDAVEESFKVKLDRANLRFPKLQYKGTPSSSVMREKMPHCDSLPKDELFDKLLPPLPNAPTANGGESKTAPKTSSERSTKAKNKENIQRTVAASAGSPFYTTPEYKIIQCRDVEYGEMTNELDAKIDLTIPRELKVIVTLPLLKSTAECALDVTKTTLHLVSEKPAKYKLELKLPYEVKESEGRATFNVEERTLTVTLPVLRKRNITLQDISSVNTATTHAKETGKLIEEISDSIPVTGGDHQLARTPSTVPAEVPKKTIFPKFSVNKMENLLAFTLSVRNVDPNTIELDCRSDAVYCRFSNVGNGYFPCFYVFFVRFPNAQVTDVQHEEWDNNLIIQITLNTANVSAYQAGPDEHDTVEYSIMEDISDKINKFGKEIEDDSLCIAVVRQAKGSAKVKSDALMSIEITKREESESELRKAQEVDTEKEEEKPSLPEPCSATSAEEGDEKDGSEAEKARAMLKAKRNSRKKKKERSLSDSFCDHLKVIVENEATTGGYDQPKDRSKKESPVVAASAPIESPESKARKARSISECGPAKESDGGEEVPTIRKYKSILKRSSYDRSISECSSVDDLGTSVEMARSIGEECRKTVRFNNAIRKQLFRSNSCILTMKKKALKRREVKRRADARRMSEGESTDNDEKDAHHQPDDEHCSSSDQHDEKDAMEDDSGVSFDSESGDKEIAAIKAEASSNGGRGKAASKRKNKGGGKSAAGSKPNNGKKQGTDAKNIQFKSDMIFDIEI
uniref:Protein kintoun n=1 Tax=Anopheles epiroticus TaxID=199890 RepID=A0A182PVF7_9DIPT